MTKKFITLGFILTALSSSALAVSPTHPSINPGNIGNTLDQTLPGAQGAIQGEFQTTTNPQYIKHAEEVTHQVILKEVHLVGAKIVPANVQALSQSMLGQPVKFKDIQQLAQQLEALYRADGYVLVQVIIPPQEINIDSGIVQLQVINGQIQHIIFTGDDPKGARTQLQRYAEQIEEEDPISYHSIDRFLILANQLPGIDVSATLIPDKTVTGAADLVVKIVQTPFSGFVNFNNWNTSYVGPYQVSAGVSAYDLFAADSLTLSGSTSINSVSELQYGSINYDVVVGKYATEINPSISSTLTQPGGSLSNLELSGLSIKYSLAVNQPLYTSTQQSLTLQTALYHTDSSNDAFSGALLRTNKLS